MPATVTSDMRPTAEFHYDAASAISQGRRDQQEDAVAADFPAGAGIGFAVLADGMGGHAAGDVASGIVVTEVFSELKLRAADPGGFERDIGGLLREAASSANDCVAHHVASYPGAYGMGATLVAPVLVGDRLYWISVGDSPLFLFRDGRLRRLNEDHSLTPQIDYLAASGLMPAEEALNHPDRNCLTSVLIGQPIPMIDCPDRPVRLAEGDLVLAASDGLLFLPDERIEAILAAHAGEPSAMIGARLLRALEDLDDPDQDNVSLCVIQVSRQAAPAVGVLEPGLPVAPPPPSPRAPGRDMVAIMVKTENNRRMLMYRSSKSGRIA